ncbi:MATH domain-containing protein [Apostasia shenzhenica]|uniref:MATH domain-containing protein n=1 Tax=Apostasia shenzhenica TaxID=1088818 RepID=A0A2I0B4V6_9ASPA|nr:MATH domain-containing protein [Apostasia shenzhenica]
MAGNSTEELGTEDGSSPAEGVSTRQRCQSVDSLAEWRSSEQVENGTPSTSPPYWDTDDDDEDEDGDCGPKPSELYGKYTWKIENFSQINKRELRSNIFEVGGYKWYVLIYPQGCDVCNHLSLFLCVANHDKLLPGWSHFAQFTIAVVNKDPKKSKYSDTLHRFWKKEHDWGWKKFMELSKVLDGYIVDDTLVIKAQVQVIREKANRPFRCLDRQYRRELVRVYLSNVEQICLRYIEDRKKKLYTLFEDNMRWSSFRAFWIGVDQTSRRCMSEEKSDTILRVVVKHFFVEKEVTSTLVMDSLYSGLKALEHQSKNSDGRLKTESEESPVPMVRVEKDMFVLADDVVSLLERVASEPLPATSLPPKDDKVALNRTKEGNCEEFSKESVEREERRLTELGRRTVEIFVLTHIFSKIEVAYQEAVAFMRQEELIREEEAAGRVQNELKAKRAAAEKDKRVKKKPAKQKRNNRKNKDKQRELKSDSVLKIKQQENSCDELVPGDLPAKQGDLLDEKLETTEDAADVSYFADDVAEPLHPDSECCDSSPALSNTNTEDTLPCIEKVPAIMDDSSSTCSTDSLPSVLPKGHQRANFLSNSRSQTSANQLKNEPIKDLQSRAPVAPSSDDVVGSCSSYHGPEAHLVEKQEETTNLQEKIIKNQGEAEKLWNSTEELSSHSSGPGRKIEPPPPCISTLPRRSAAPASKSPQPWSSKPEPQRIAGPAAPKTIASQPLAAISRPSSAPLIPAAPRPTAPVISTVQRIPVLSRSISAAGRLGADPSPSVYTPQSYRNAIIGKTSTSFSHSATTSSASMLPPQPHTRKELHMNSRPSFTFGSVKPEAFAIHEQRNDDRSHRAAASELNGNPSLARGIEKLDINGNQQAAIQQLFQPTGVVADEFPHLDIINELLNEEQNFVGNGRNGGGLYRVGFPGEASNEIDSYADPYYDAGFPNSHVSYPGSPFQRLMDGHMAGMVGLQMSPGQFPFSHGDLPNMNVGREDSDEYSYRQIFDYSANIGRGANRYGMYRP